jgi:hypothetical protein
LGAVGPRIEKKHPQPLPAIDAYQALGLSSSIADYSDTGVDEFAWSNLICLAWHVRKAFAGVSSSGDACDLGS